MGEVGDDGETLVFAVAAVVAAVVVGLMILDAL